MRSVLHSAVVLAVGIVSLCGVGPLHGADYPNKPIRIVTGTVGLIDIQARIFAEKLGARLRQPVVVEPRVGASGYIGLSSVLNAEPDGYTVYMNTSSTLSMPALMKSFAFDLAKDANQITIIAYGRQVSIAHASLPVQNLAELVAYMKSNPGKVNVAAGNAVARLQTYFYKQKTGADFQIIEYRSPVEVTNAVVAGHVHAVLAANTQVIRPFAEAGKVRLLSVTGATRDALLPGVPTLAESTSAEIRELAKSALFAPFWVGPLVPGKTPREIVDVLYSATQEIVKEPDFVKKMANIGLETISSIPTPAQAQAQSVSGAAEISAIAKQAGVKPQ